MNKEIHLNNIKLILSNDYESVNLLFDNDTILFVNQNTENLIYLIESNFNIVNSHYKHLVTNYADEFIPEELDYLSCKIVLFYLYLYNSWKNTYRKQNNRNLGFKKEDFNNPSTFDIIFKYYSLKYPDNWIDKCSKLLDINKEELYRIYKERVNFYNF